MRLHKALEHKRHAMHLKNHFFVFLFLLFIPGVSFAESIRSFNSDIDISGDGSFVVVETIEYSFTEARHGIFRSIPTKHPQEPSAWYKDRYIEIEIFNVTLDKNSVPYEEDRKSDVVLLKIGDPNTTLSGVHTYEITYKVVGGLSFFTYGGADFYWNTTGHEWEVPIRTTKTIVTGPSGLFTGERACYSGVLDASLSCTGVRNDGESVVFEANNLSLGEGVTISLALDRSKVERVILEKNQMLILWVIGILLWFIALIYFVYRYKTEYKTENSVIAQYEPYQDFKPMYSGLLFDGMLNAHDITASIVYLAQQGFIKIKKTQEKVLFFFEVDDYEITLLKPIAQIASPFQKDVLVLLFGMAESEGSPVTLSSLKKNLKKQAENKKILIQLKKDLEKDLVAAGFFQVYIPRRYIAAAGIAFVFVGFFAIEFVFTLISSRVAAFVVIGLLSFAVLGFLYRRRTRKGYEALDHLEGFKLFLSVTEKERFEFHNAPSKNPEQFMEYLPYAIAFGVEAEWAEVFHDITIPDPGWFDGGNVGHFSATNLTTSLGAFSTAFANSSGSSSSSGGGSAGGGGGGGGGGSW